MEKRTLKRFTKLFITFCGVFISSILFNGCYSDNAEELYPGIQKCDTVAMKYSVHISPILSANCAISGCHTSSASAGGYVLDSHAETVLVPKDKFLKSIKHLPGASQMPKSANKLDDCSIIKINAWINQGSLNN